MAEVAGSVGHCPPLGLCPYLESHSIVIVESKPQSLGAHGGGAGSSHCLLSCPSRWTPGCRGDS